MKAIGTPEERKARKKLLALARNRKWRSRNKRKPLTETQRLRRNETARLRRAKNPKLARTKAKEWCKANSEKVRAYSSKWKSENPDWFPNYYQARKPKYRASYEKRIADPEKRARIREVAGRLRKYKLKTSIQHRLRAALRGKIKLAIRNYRHRGHIRKHATTMALLGCDVPFFMEWIASQFKEGMSWANYGHTTWHLDHIKPISSFDLSDKEQMKACFHYTNYQPLWAIDNMRKGAKILLFQPTKTSADIVASEHAASAE